MKKTIHSISITDHLEAPYFQFRTTPGHEPLFLEFCKQQRIAFQRFNDPDWPAASTFRFDCELSQFRQLLDYHLEAGYPFGFCNFDPDVPDQPAIEFEDDLATYDFG